MKRFLFLVILLSIWGQMGKLKAINPLIGDSIVGEKCDNTKVYPKDLVASKSGDKYGFVNTEEEVVIPYIYDYAMWYSDGLAAVNVDGKWGLVDRDNKVIVFWQYDMVSPIGFTEGLLAVQLNNKWGYIDRTGREVIPFQYDYVKPFSRGLAHVAYRKRLESRFGEYLEEFNGYIDKRNNRYPTEEEGLAELEKTPLLKDVPDLKPCGMRSLMIRNME